MLSGNKLGKGKEEIVQRSADLTLLLVDGLALLLLYSAALLLRAGCTGISDSLALLLCHCLAHRSSGLAAVLFSDSLAALLKHRAALVLSDSVIHRCAVLLFPSTAAAAVCGEVRSALLLTKIIRNI